ncbi:MAG: phosphatidylcholine/phosphatidylserine synthase [Nitratireductor sp.]
MFGFSKNAIWAFGVHILTASGAFLAFLALVAAAQKQFEVSFFWLGVALLVDGVDGPLARKLEVKKWWPYWSGDLLDCVIDYVTFVMIPAFIFYQSELVGESASFIAAAIIVTTGAIYYADTRTKTHDYGFKGFPICWNMLVFVLYIIQPNQLLAFLVVLVAALLIFAPIYFVHPVRVKAWRALNLGMLAVWGFVGLFMLYLKYNLQTVPSVLELLLIASSVYLFCIGGILQFMGKLK